MKVPLSWLKEYLDFSLSAQKLAEVLTLSGVEVEGIESIGQESVLDISLTPNLGHCLSILGLARELSALLDTPLKKPTFSFTEEGQPIEKYVGVTIVDNKQCLRYACRLLTQVRVGPSPDWLKRRLELCGMRSINNVVDVSNLVLLEWGQPLHIFDYAKIADKRILIASQTPFATLETLDDVVRPIPPDALLICDAEKPLAFAGVMGGKHSAISEETQTILIESAYFTSRAIRRSSRSLGLRTDAAQRFERGIDPLGVVDALNYAVYHLQQVAGGVIAQGAIDQKVETFERRKIACRIARVNALLGTSLSLREVARWLTRLGMEVEERQTELIAHVPPYRSDLTIEEDLIEEVARLYGYNNIELRPPRMLASPLPHSPLYLFENEMRSRLVSQGLQEFLHCDLISPSQAKMLSENSLSEKASVTVLHAKSIEQSVLRTSLLASLLQAVKYNVDHYQSDIAGFEIGKIYFRQEEKWIEEPTLAIALSGKRTPYHWDPKPEEFDFFDLKGVVENVFEGLCREKLDFEVSHFHHFHPGCQAFIKIGETIIGAMGEVHPTHLETVDIPQRVYFAEWSVREVMRHLFKLQSVVDAPLYPGSERDWTVTLPDALSVQRVLEAIWSVKEPLLERVSLLDLYKSEQIGKDKKNVTLRFFYRSSERTVEFDAVEKAHAKRMQAVAQNLNV